MSSAAERQARYRERRRQGKMVVPVEIEVANLDALCRAGLVVDGETDPAEIGFGVRAILDAWIAESAMKKSVTRYANKLGTMPRFDHQPTPAFQPEKEKHDDRR